MNCVVLSLAGVITLRRRDFIKGVVTLPVVWPALAHAQQPAMSVIGWLSSGTPRTFSKFLKAFQQGLQEQGFVEGRNLAIKYQWAEGHFDDLDAMARELVADRVTLIAATGGTRSAQAAKNATATIPIVFVLGVDPVKLGLVTSFNKPDGNITGITIIANELATKRLKLLYDLDPGIRNAAMLVNPESPTADVEIESEKAAAGSTGRPFFVLEAGSSGEIDTAFASAVEKQVRALVMSPDPFFMTRRAQIVALAAKYKILVIYAFREFVDDGGLMSYGPSLASGYRVAGLYAGRILNGTKPGDLPIEAPVAFEFLINLKTAKSLGLTIPANLLSIADEVIE